MTALTAQHDIAPPDSRSLPDSGPVRVATHRHRPLFRAFLAATRAGPSDTVLDVGVTRDRSTPFGAWYPHKSRLARAGLDDAFDDGSFDYVHARAVLEHIGDRASQAEFVRQTWRVARKGIFVATPHRGVLRRRLGRDAAEQTLNRLSAPDLLDLARTAGISSGEIWRVSPFLWTTSLVLVALRR